MRNEELLEVIEQAAREKATKLKLNNCNLTIWPPEFWELINLNILELPDNELTSLPPEIVKLTNLTELDISCNKLTILPPEIGQLSKLRKLKVRGNKLSSLPHQIVQLSNLTKLDISENKLSSLPPEIVQLSNLQVLDIGGNQISSLPPEIMQLSNLKVLVLSRNKLTSLPCAIGELTNLTELYIRGNQLTSLPREIGKLTNLKGLYLTSNQVKSLPPEIGELSQLTYLYLTDNQIGSLPPEIGKLSKLTKLELMENKQHQVSPALITKLTPTQESLIPVYREKWTRIAMCTDRIDRPLAADAVKGIYEILGYREPEILFCDSWEQGLIEQKNRPELGINIDLIELNEEISQRLLRLLDLQIDRNIRDELNRRLSVFINLGGFERRFGRAEFNFSLIRRNNLSLSYVDYCVEVLNCLHNQKLWKLSKSLAKNSGWTFPFRDVCWVCDRPLVIRLDNEGRLHAEGEPAMKFADGFRVYAHHGVRLPAEYGKVHSEHWRAEWLLSERNAEVRRGLIQGIGYDRICQELKATQLDTWQEYQLLRINKIVDWGGVHLLKMTCPSTGYIHAIRVPPNISSARDAIKWVNWEIDPEEFSVQS